MNDIELANYRIDRLKEAVDRVSQGNKSDFGRKLGFKDGAFIRQMLAGTRPVTEKTVRAIEALHSMKGWFNESNNATTAVKHTHHAAEPTSVYGDSTAWPLKKATPERIHALTPKQRQQADTAFDAILRGFEAERAEKP